MDAPESEIYDFTSGDPVERPKQATDYKQKFWRDHDTPLVIDNGSYHCRVGWASESEPRYDFRNILAKPRTKATGQTVSIVGEYDLEAARPFDFSRSSVRSAFESNVVFQFETMEAIFDYSFDRLGIYGGSVNHPLVLTECPLNPLFSRSKMAELLFEVYGIPSLAFGVDAVFAHSFNRRKQICGPDGFLVSAGHAATHVIPMVGGEPLLSASVRTPIGGYQSTDFMKRLLSLHYPQHTLSLNWERTEEMKHRHCYVAEDYTQEIRRYQKDETFAKKQTKVWQLPYIPPPEEPKGPTEEELERKAAIREKSGQRLKDLAAAKRAAKVLELEGQLSSLEVLKISLEGLSETQILRVLSEAEFGTRKEFETQIGKVNKELKKAKGEVVEEEGTEKDEIPIGQKYPLLDVPDADLNPEQLKEKKRQRIHKNSAEGRARVKQRREEEKAKEEKEREREEERRLANPEAFLEETRTRFLSLSSKREERKRRKSGTASSAKAKGGGTGVNVVNSGTSGRGERLTSVQRERMKLLTTAIFDKGKGEDTFGMNESDWQLYKQMGREEEEEESVEETAEYSRLLAKLQEIDPTFLDPSSSTLENNGNGTSGGPINSTKKFPTIEDFRIPLGIERIRASEILFQPSIVAVDQAGLGEILLTSLQRCPKEVRERVARGKVLLTGGNCLLPGTDIRISSEMRKIRPLSSEVEVVRAFDPILDAWHGAAEFAQELRLKSNFFSKEEYEERGSEWFRNYSITYDRG